MISPRSGSTARSPKPRREDKDKDKKTAKSPNDSPREHEEEDADSVEARRPTSARSGIKAKVTSPSSVLPLLPFLFPL